MAQAPSDSYCLIIIPVPNRRRSGSNHHEASNSAKSNRREQRQPDWKGRGGRGDAKKKSNTQSTATRTHRTKQKSQCILFSISISHRSRQVNSSQQLPITSIIHPANQDKANSGMQSVRRWDTTLCFFFLFFKAPKGREGGGEEKQSHQEHNGLGRRERYKGDTKTVHTWNH